MIENNPAALELLDGDAPVWVLDAVDGTSNFAKGSPDFAVMVALVRRRQTIAGGYSDPLTATCTLANSEQGRFEMVSR